MRIFLTLAFFAGLQLAASADITTDPVSRTVIPSLSTTFPVKLNATGSVAGINGQLNYDSSAFSNPSIELQAGASSSAFIVASNVVTPGTFRFVIYGNPTTNFNLAAPVMNIRLVTAASLSQPSYTATYTLTAASDNLGTSLANVSFGAVTLTKFVAKNAAQGWAIYD